MRTLLLASGLLLFVPSAIFAQTPVPASYSPGQTQNDIRQALIGNWTGLLEYRDYQELATSLKRVQLPTWLAITGSGANLTERFVYDDGPAKTVESTQTVVFDPAASTYTESETGKPASVYQVIGYDKLKSGRGELVLSGTGTDNGKATESRITLAVRRNLLTWLLEVRPAGSTEPFAFRHRFVFTRAEPPATPAK